MLSYRSTAISRRRYHSPGAHDAAVPKRAQHSTSTIHIILTGKRRVEKDDPQSKEKETREENGEEHAKERGLGSR